MWQISVCCVELQYQIFYSAGKVGEIIENLCHYFIGLLQDGPQSIEIPGSVLESAS